MKLNWTKSDHNLPPESGLYLCWERYYSPTTHKPVFGYYEKESGRWETEIAEDWSNVTHWMPLPSAPED